MCQTIWAPLDHVFSQTVTSGQIGDLRERYGGKTVTTWRFSFISHIDSLRVTACLQKRHEVTSLFCDSVPFCGLLFIEGSGCWTRIIPLLVRRGGCGIKKISAKPTLAPQTGWSLTSNFRCERRLFLDGCALSGLRGLRPPAAVAYSPPHEEGNKANTLTRSALDAPRRSQSIPRRLPMPPV